MPFDNTTWTDPVLAADLAALREMHRRMSKKGAWVQRQMTFGAAHCLVGWVDTVALPLRLEDRIDRYNRQVRLYGYLAAALPRHREDFDAREAVMSFNDDINTTKRMAVSLVSRAIKKLEAKT